MEKKIMEEKGLRYHTCLIDKKSNDIIFIIPDTKDQLEKEESLTEQIYAKLISYANLHDNYSIAIEEVQGYLRALCRHSPNDKEWIAKIAEIAGQKFLDAIMESKRKSLLQSVKDKEMFLKVKEVKGGKR